MSYVIAGYTLTGGSIGVYALWVVRRIHQARATASGITVTRDR